MRPLMDQLVSKVTPDNASIASQSAKESIRVKYRLPIVDQAIASLTNRFEQYQG
jgi:hypothetical protein